MRSFPETDIDPILLSLCSVLICSCNRENIEIVKTLGLLQIIIIIIIII